MCGGHLTQETTSSGCKFHVSLDDFDEFNQIAQERLLHSEPTLRTRVTNRCLRMYSVSEEVPLWNIGTPISGKTFVQLRSIPKKIMSKFNYLPSI